MSEKSVVFVTGASSGFGRLIVEAVARRGHTAIAGMRDPQGKNAQAASELGRVAKDEKLPIHVVPLDVTSADSANAAAKAAATKAGRIDALINNAGIACFGITEAFTDEQVAEQFNTNVFGAVRMNRAVLPYMRGSGRGLIVQISTSIGRSPMPFMGIYGATKAAAEVLAEEARYTLAPLGIDSVILQAGIYPTPMQQKMAQPADGARIQGYGPLFPVMEQMGKAMQYMLSSKPDPQEVADAVVKLLEAAPGTRPLRTMVGATHPNGVRELNEATDGVIRGFYPMMGIGNLLQFRNGK